MERVQTREWQKFGFGGPPQPWEHGAQRDLDRLATSYYLDILQTRQTIRASARPGTSAHRAEELYTTATRHKHEIDYTLRHPATPAERARVEDRLGSLMRIGMLMRELLDGPSSGPTPEPMSAA
jgi:hypothetical protein